MDNSVDAIVRDTKIIATSVLVLVGGGTLLLLSVTAYPKIAFFGTVLLGLLGILVLIWSR